MYPSSALHRTSHSTASTAAQLPGGPCMTKWPRWHYHRQADRTEHARQALAHVTCQLSQGSALPHSAQADHRSYLHRKLQGAGSLVAAVRGKLHGEDQGPRSADQALAQARSIRNVQGHLQRLTRTQAFNQSLSHALCVATFVACTRAVPTPLERSAT